MKRRCHIKNVIYYSPDRRNSRKENVDKPTKKLPFMLFQLTNRKWIQGQWRQRSAEQTRGESGKSESCWESRERGRATLRHPASQWQEADHSKKKRKKCNLWQPNLLKQDKASQRCDYSRFDMWHVSVLLSSNVYIVTVVISWVGKLYQNSNLIIMLQTCWGSWCCQG